jgi:hypothetical protein
MKNDPKDKKRDQELKEDILENRKEKEGKTKFEQDQDEPVMGEEKVETKGFNSDNKSTPDGKGGEGQSASSVPQEKQKQNTRQSGE